MYKISTLLFAIVIAAAAVAQTGTKIVSYAGDKLSMNMPAGMDTMSTDNIWTKYHKTPDGKTKYFANTDVSFSMVLNEVANKVTEADMVKHKDDLTAALQTKYELSENQVLTVNGHKIVVVAFSSDAPNSKIFNRRFFAVAGGKLVSASFNTTDEDLEIRKAVIEACIRSVLIKP